MMDEPISQSMNELREPPQFEHPRMPAAIANNLSFAPGSDIEMSITIAEYSQPDPQADFSVDFHEVNDLLISLDEAIGPQILHSDVPANIVERVAEVQNEDGQFISQLSVLLNEWFNKENLDSTDDAEPLAQGLDSPEKRRERTYAMLRKAAAEKAESKRLMERMGEVSPDAGNNGAGSAKESAANKKASAQNARGTSFNGPSFVDPSLIDRSQRVPKSGERSTSGGDRSTSGRVHGSASDNRRRSRNRDRHDVARQVSPMPNGMRKEEAADGSYVLKDAVGRVTEARSHDGAIMNFSYDNRGHLKSFVRSDLTGKIHTTGIKDRHGVVVRDDHGALRAQGDSMTVDSYGCVSIRKFDGQFWSLDVLRGIHIERRILEDSSGNWNCLTALLTCDGFRMVTRFQKLQESKRESYRKYGDWLGSMECSKFRFYGRDGSMIQFENDEDLEALRPSRIWSAGSRAVDREWIGRRQAGTAWDAVHRYISQYLSAL
ncbi:MAG: hypothetical protein SGJ27_07560 [Candidatus Melainabacteria bacterium]|nr:hypothetical protein [Candidatus Melainabacteria bacterium]